MNNTSFLVAADIPLLFYFSYIYQVIQRKGQIPRPLFSAQSAKVLGMRVQILIFATKKIALRQGVELFSTHGRNKKAKPIKFKHFYKKLLTSLFLHFSKSKQD